VKELRVWLRDVDGDDIADAQPHDLDCVVVAGRLVGSFPRVNESDRVRPPEVVEEAPRDVHPIIVARLDNGLLDVDLGVFVLKRKVFVRRKAGANSRGGDEEAEHQLTDGDQTDRLVS
jgi:hypothetical protein